MSGKEKNLKRYCLVWYDHSVLECLWLEVGNLEPAILLRKVSTDAGIDFNLQFQAALLTFMKCGISMDGRSNKEV